MSVDGKINALNVAVREAIPHLRGLARNTPFARILVRAVTFSDGARWHVGQPTPVESFTWSNVQAYGETDLGAALRLVTASFDTGSFAYALPPSLVLVSDGFPTDDFSDALAELVSHPLGKKTVRVAVGIGQDADEDTLASFMGGPPARSLRVHNPEMLVSYLRQASTAALASSASSSAHPPFTSDGDEMFASGWSQAGGESRVW
jgi:uncharacterized protein YegL